jgi:hypothetical protein
VGVLEEGNTVFFGWKDVVLYGGLLGTTNHMWEKCKTVGNSAVSSCFVGQQ